jgi:hypothetical protein
MNDLSTLLRYEANSRREAAALARKEDWDYGEVADTEAYQRVADAAADYGIELPSFEAVRVFRYPNSYARVAWDEGELTFSVETEGEGLRLHMSFESERISVAVRSRNDFLEFLHKSAPIYGEHARYQRNALEIDTWQEKKPVASNPVWSAIDHRGAWLFFDTRPWPMELTVGSFNPDHSIQFLVDNTNLDRLVSFFDSDIEGEIFDGPGFKTLSWADCSQDDTIFLFAKDRLNVVPVRMWGYKSGKYIDSLETYLEQVQDHVRSYVAWLEERPSE